MLCKGFHRVVVVLPYIITGSVLDALVQAEVLQNDSSGYVVESSGKFVKTRKKRGEEKPVGILIRMSQAEIEYFDLETFNHTIGVA